MIRYKLAELMSLKQFAEGRRLTIQEVAESANVNRMTLSKILNQRGYNTGTDVLDKLCVYFNCGLEDLAEHIPDAAVARRGSKGGK